MSFDVILNCLRENILDVIGLTLAAIEIYFPKTSKKLEERIDEFQNISKKTSIQYGKSVLNLFKLSGELFSETVLGRYGNGPLSKGLKIFPILLIILIIMFVNETLKVKNTSVINLFLMVLFIIVFAFLGSVLIYVVLGIFIWIFTTGVLFFISPIVTVLAFLFFYIIKILNRITFGNAIGSIGLTLSVLDIITGVLGL